LETNISHIATMALQTSVCHQLHILVVDVGERQTTITVGEC